MVEILPNFMKYDGILDTSIRLIPCIHPVSTDIRSTLTAVVTTDLFPENPKILRTSADPAATPNSRIEQIISL